MLLSRILTRLLVATALTAPAVAFAAPANACFATLAATRSGTLGQVRSAEVTPDGRSVIFLRSDAREATLHLYRYDLADRSTHELAGGDDAPEHLSVEEKARRERARLAMSGITEFHIAPDGRTLLAARGGTLLRVDIASGATTTLPGSWIAPRLSPDGTQVAAVRDDDLHVIDLATGKDHQLTSGGTEDVTHGLAEFAAAEELQRADGTWWSPDGASLLYEEADSRGVETHYITNPETPQVAPVAFRYPRAGTDNAKIRLGLVGTKGGPTRWVQWDSQALPYLARVVWRREGGLFLIVLNRAQTEEQVLAVDPATGASHVVLTDRDAAWLDLTPAEKSGGVDLPYALPGGDFLWAAQRGPHWQLERHHADGTLVRAYAGAAPFVALDDVNPANQSAIIATNPDRIDARLLRLDLASGATTPLAAEPGIHTAQFTHDQHDVFVDSLNGADGTRSARVVDVAGKVRAVLPATAEALPFKVNTEFTRAGSLDFDALLIRPHGFVAGRRYPVVLSVYAGPGYKEVLHTPATYAEDQCLADQGYVVVSFDGRGTPGRDHDFERATKNDLIDLPLADQIDGLQALGKRYHELDLSRVGVYGWSFGGYFTAMATIRRPDVFKVGVAGAPPVDFADYDTAYTERYLGTPQNDPEGYRKSNVLTYAAGLSRPLMILHGLTDDNVYFENTMKLTQALLLAGKPYDLRLLPGTHMLVDPALRARIDQTRADYLAGVLKPKP